MLGKRLLSAHRDDFCILHRRLKRARSGHAARAEFAEASALFVSRPSGWVLTQPQRIAAAVAQSSRRHDRLHLPKGINAVLHLAYHQKQVAGLLRP